MEKRKPTYELQEVWKLTFVCTITEDSLGLEYLKEIILYDIPYYTDAGRNYIRKYIFTSINNTLKLLK